MTVIKFVNDRNISAREMEGLQTNYTNQEWILTLSNPHEKQEQAIEDLRSLLLRASLYTLVTRIQEVNDLDERERMAIAEDCAQEACQTVLAHLHEFRGESKFTTWAYKFAVNITLTRIRHERWKNISLDTLTEDDELDWLQWKESLQSGDNEMPVLQAEAGKLIENVIRQQLTGRQRQVLKWIAFDGVPMDAVVERLDTNRNAVYKLLHDARIKVKRQLMAHGYQLEEIYDLFERTS